MLPSVAASVNNEITDLSTPYVYTAAGNVTSLIVTKPCDLVSYIAGLQQVTERCLTVLQQCAQQLLCNLHRKKAALCEPCGRCYHQCASTAAPYPAPSPRLSRHRLDVSDTYSAEYARLPQSPTLELASRMGVHTTLRGLALLQGRDS